MKYDANILYNVLGFSKIYVFGILCFRCWNQWKSVSL